MSQAEELLTGMSEEIPVHTHPVPDTDTYFVIDPITRKIENTNRKKNVVMQYDHNSERFTFELPRYIDGHDMLECTSVTVNVDNNEVIESDGVEEVEPRVNSDAPDITDLRAHPNDPEKVICSWLISRNSTQLAGILSFHIEFKCVDSNGNVVEEWSTDDYDEIQVKARKKNGEAAVVKHTDLLEQWRTRIFGAGDSVMANIAAEGEAQVAAVKAESETQQESVELKGVQTLDSIPEDYTEVDAMADEAVRSKGDAIVCEAAGESIALKDSSNDHIRGLKLFGKSKQATTTGKNLLDISKLAVSGIEVSGNIIKVYPSTTGQAVVSPVALGEFLSASVGETVVLSGTTTGSNLIYIIDAETSWHFGSSIVLTETMLASKVFLYGADIGTRATITNLMARYPETDDAYEPYTGGKPSPNPEYPQDIVSVTNPNVRICGKNLLNNVRYTTTQDGVTFTVKDDKSVVLNGTAEQDIYFYLTDDTLLAPGIYNLSGSPEGSSTSTYYMYVYPDYHSDQHGSGFTFEVKETTVYSARIYVKKDTICNNVVFKPQIERGSKTTTYEPYAGGSIDITHTLPGIPVTSGGNYTDSDGQQWICDEIDLERGVYMQRIIKHVFDGSSDEKWANGYVADGINNRFQIGVPDIGYIPCTPNVPGVKRAFCNSFRFAISELGIPAVGMFRAAIDKVTSNVYILFNPGTDLIPLEDVATWKAYISEHPITCYLPVTSPIETPLTAEEIMAFKALRTNYPNTTILNDAGAWMSVKYNADTKSYVDALKAVKIVDSSTGVVCELKIVDGVLIIETVK